MATAKYNSRGVVSKSIDAGGEAEHELADGLEKQAKDFGDRWPRSAAVLGDLPSRRPTWRRRSRAASLGLRPLKSGRANAGEVSPSMAPTDLRRFRALLARSARFPAYRCISLRIRGETPAR